MFKDIIIENIDHFGRGITHINNKIVFIPNTLKDEIVDIKIISEKKKYMEGEVIKYKRKAKNRINSPCPYFNLCGGCNLLHLDYQNTINFKINKIKELLNKNKININNIEIIKNENPFNYRNKLSLKIVKGEIGFYKTKTHELVEINKCLIANPTINKVIENYKLLNLSEGSLTIRTNLNQEVLLIINSINKNYNINLKELKDKIKLNGIVYNNKTIYGDNFLYERIKGHLFKISYDSFFQVNPYITKYLFNIINQNIETSNKVLDLYSGVGTLGIVASKKAESVLSVEIVKNAVINGIFNAKLNNCSNIEFMLGDVSKLVENINQEYDTLIVDPPRSGLDKNTIKFITGKSFNKIIYISCDPNTLMRDLKLLESKYRLAKYIILDMFSNTYHVESVCILTRK